VPFREQERVVRHHYVAKGEDMRDRFELNCKTVGLVFFCIGAFYALTAIPLFLRKPADIKRMVPQSALRVFSEADIAELQAATSYTWKYALKTLLLSGIAPMLTGLYLMRSNNLFVRLCYPIRGGKSAPSPGITTAVAEPDAAPKAAGNSDERKPESKYAPPGYFE
jgi:hypothetical protein